MTLKELLKKQFVKAAIERTCGSSMEIITRPASFVLKGEEVSNPNKVSRVIILPPKGYTANARDQMNSHDEARRATIEFKGALRPDKQSFSKLKLALLFSAINKTDKTNDLDVPYQEYNQGSTNVVSKIYSGGEPPFSVAKEDGYGFYHNLTNLTNEWLFLILNKELRLQKSVALDDKLSGLPENESRALRDLYKGIVKYGDEIFNRTAETVNKVVQIAPEKSLPALGEMLYAYDTGKHEACSVFATIMKIGKRKPHETLQFLNEAINANSVPEYYANQLSQKIYRMIDGNSEKLGLT